MTERPVLLFVSTRFLFPADSGGKIRTGQVLRGLKGGHFRVRLAMPCDESLRTAYRAEIDELCDDLVCLPPQRSSGPGRTFRRLLAVFRSRPVPVETDRNEAARQVVATEIGRRPAVAVFDVPHAAVLAPPRIDCPSVMFTHNIEAEIFRRHWEVAGNPLHRRLWKSQYSKMLAFERDVLRGFDTTIAVSERDREYFIEEYGVVQSHAIPTGVDTEYFAYREPSRDLQVVFCGSMDWMANIDGIEYFHDQVWPKIRAAVDGARMKVVGRTPPAGLARRVAAKSPDWEFTGFVDDVRDHVAGSAVFVIPLRVGGGTRIKAFEAMAMGCPVVSTSIGIEGLPVEDGVHYRNGDSADALADSVIALLEDRDERYRLSRAARQLVEERFGFRRAAAVFEEICRATVARCGRGPA